MKLTKTEFSELMTEFINIVTRLETVHEYALKTKDYKEAAREMTEAYILDAEYVIEKYSEKA